MIPGPVYRFFRWNYPRRWFRAAVVPAYERARFGFSRWDVIALGIDKTMLPALGEALVLLADHGHGYPLSFDTYEEWANLLRLHGRSLQRLRMDVYDGAPATAGRTPEELHEEIDHGVREALAFVAEHYGSLWD